MVKEKLLILKSQPKWIARTMFWIWAVAWLFLALHLYPIWWSNAENKETYSSIVTYDTSNNVSYVLNSWFDTVQEFTWVGTITITDWITTITMLDRNLWAKDAGTGCNYNDRWNNEEWTCWYHFQWWNSYGFNPFDDSVKSVYDQSIDTSGYGPWNFYIWNIFRILDFDGYKDWSRPQNDGLRWWKNDSIDNNMWLYLDNRENRQWPCPDWYHIPSIGEWNKVVEMWIADYTSKWGENTISIGGSWILKFYFNNDLALKQFSSDFKIPLASCRYDLSAWVLLSSIWHYRSSSPNGENAYYFTIGSGRNSNTNSWLMTASSSNTRAMGFSIRCFKNTGFDVKSTIAPECTIQYSTNSPTSWNVEAILTWCNEPVTVTNNNWNTWYIFTGNGSFTFEFEDWTGNTWEATATVSRIDKDSPSCETIQYSTSFPTSWDVEAVLTWCSESITVTNNSGSSGYIFTGNGSFTFEFEDWVGNTWEATATVTRIDKDSPSCGISYNTTWLTNQNVTATLTCDEDFVVTNNSGSTGYIFTGNSSFTFEFNDWVGNTWDATATVSRIDKDSPSCETIQYSTNSPTSWDVEAVLTWCSESITVTNNSGSTGYIFTGNGSFTFEFNDWAGNTWEATATVTRIDLPPTCNVAYNITWWTNQNVTATLTWCSETILWPLSHVFTGNWTYTFEFKDLTDNTWSTTATVNWITGNTTYVNVEWYEFIWNDLTICHSNNSGNCITIMDRNLWATTNDITKTWSYGYHYQWWNNYWFNPFESIEITTGKAIWNNEYNNKWYYNTKFIVWDNTIWSEYRDDEVIYSWGHNIYNYHDWIWWWYYDNNSNNRWVNLNNYTDRQWPCPDGYHVPSAGERWLLVKYYIDTYADDIRLYEGDSSSASIWGSWLYYFSDTGTRLRFQRYFKIPFAGSRYRSGGSVWHLGYFGNYRSSSAVNNGGNSINFTIRDSDVWKDNGYRVRTEWESIRCFKNSSWYYSSNTWYRSSNTWKYFSIIISNTVNVWEYTDFTVKVIKNWQIYRNYAGSVFFEILDSSWNILKDYNLYSLPSNEWYDFEISDYWKKTFRNWLRINKAWTYKLLVIDLFEWNFLWSVTFVVRWGHGSANVTYDTSKFDSKYSDEMNRAYQYARYYKITTKDTIREANMYSGLTRVAMAKMLTNYAVNVLGIKDFDTSKNCKFKDVSEALDKQYDYWVTKACQLGIMWVNMKNNNFNPYDPVTRAQFATALSRLLFLTKDWTDKYYSTHISKLQRDKIITNTDPTLKELRWYVMLMLMRVWK